MLDRLVRVVRVRLEGLQGFLCAAVTGQGLRLVTASEFGPRIVARRGASTSLRDAVDDCGGTKLIVAVFAHSHIELLFVFVFLVRALVLRDLPSRRVERDFV